MGEVESRDWVEDAGHENGRYTCLCVLCRNLFIGHKRRVVCRTCALEGAEAARLKGALKQIESIAQSGPEWSGRIQRICYETLGIYPDATETVP